MGDARKQKQWVNWKTIRFFELRPGDVFRWPTLDNCASASKWMRTCVSMRDTLPVHLHSPEAGILALYINHVGDIEELHLRRSSRVWVMNNEISHS